MKPSGAMVPEDGRADDGGTNDGTNGRTGRTFHSGYVALAGRPNVGKSTLLNTLLGERLAITTPRPQTTRDRILGVLTEPDSQIVFIDTPGMHDPRDRLGEYMVREARGGYQDADVILCLVEPGRPRQGDIDILGMLRPLGPPVVLVINKIDRIGRAAILRVIDGFRTLGDFAHVVPVSARAGTNVDRLLGCVRELLPEGPAYYPEDTLTDRTERFLAAEIIREQLILRTGDELPFSIAVEILSYEEITGGGAKVGAVVYVERESQKGIIIGKGGSKLKDVGSAARKRLAGQLGGDVHLSLRVKVKRAWRDRSRSLKDLGYDG